MVLFANENSSAVGVPIRIGSIKINSVCIDCLFVYAKIVQIKCAAKASFLLKSITFAFGTGGGENKNHRVFEI